MLQSPKRGEKLKEKLNLFTIFECVPYEHRSRAEVAEGEGDLNGFGMNSAYGNRSTTLSATCQYIDPSRSTIKFFYTTREKRFMVVTGLKSE